jgi:hypothetical protein
LVQKLVMSHCPKWVFEAACAHAASEFLSRQLDLHTVSSGYASVLSSFYQNINPAEVASVVERTLRFLDELDAGESAAPLAIGFCYYKIYYEQPNKARKLKGIFGSADEPVKNLEHNAEAAVKAFKAYVYALRNEVAELAPSGWKLSDVEHSDVFQKLAKQNLSPLDFL